MFKRKLYEYALTSATMKVRCLLSTITTIARAIGETAAMLKWDIEQ